MTNPYLNSPEKYFFVKVKPQTFWEFLGQMLPKGIPCDWVEKNTNTDNIGARIFTKKLTPEQVEIIRQKVAEARNIPVEEVIGEFFINSENIEQAYDANNVPINLEMYALTTEVLRKVSKIEEIHFQTSGLDLHCLIGIMQLALRHPGLENSPTGARAKEIALSFISYLAQGDPNIEKFYNYGFDPTLDQPATINDSN